MIVISDASPLINLAVIDQLDLLQQLYQEIIIPEAVYRELVEKGAGQTLADELGNIDWIKSQQVENRNLAEALKLELDDGEAEAIALAVETKASLLLIDERKGRSIANNFDLQYIGIIGVLIEAKASQLIPEVKSVLDNLIVKAGFWISDSLYQRILELSDE